MKLSKIKNKKLRKKIKTSSSAENLFIIALMDIIKKQLNKYDFKDDDYSTFEKSIQNLDLRKLPKMSKVLGKKILKKNREGFNGIMNSLVEGMSTTENKKREEKMFKKAVNSLAKEERFFEPLMEKFSENMGKIKDIPMQLTKTLRKAYMKGEGLRGTEFEKMIYNTMKKRAKLIVRTESSKINSAFTEIRAKSLGIRGYIWSTSEDKRVRDSHSAMDNVLVFWNDPPTFRNITKAGKVSDVTAGAGEIYNCRCIMLPVFELSDIQFPVKVAERALLTERYVGKNKYNLTVKGIKTYTKDEFIKRYGAEVKK